jgi:hypothetical protein
MHGDHGCLQESVEHVELRRMLAEATAQDLAREIGWPSGRGLALNVGRFSQSREQALQELAGWYAEGKLKSREDIVVEIDSFPDARLSASVARRGPPQLAARRLKSAESASRSLRRSGAGSRRTGA